MDEPVEKGARRDDDGPAGVEEARAVDDALDPAALDGNAVDEALPELQVFLMLHDGLHGEAVKVRLAAPAQDGKANRELCRFLAEAFGVPLGAVELLSGESSRHKRVKIRSPRLWPPALATWQ